MSDPSPPPPSPPPPPTKRWARLRHDIQSVLRRGAWYVVRNLGPDEVALEVDNVTLRVAREHVEITDTRPNRWTIVPRPQDADKLPESWGFFYVVCPNCAARAPVGRPSGEKRCTRCEQSFAVAWDERYLRPT